MNKNYVLLKTKLSALTGGLVGLILGLLAVKLWFIWALLTFMLNFIPNVGSMIAMLLPIPIIIVDDELGPGSKVPPPPCLIIRLSTHRFCIAILYCVDCSARGPSDSPAQVAAFFLPALVQLYVGNVLEPMVFGKSLNLTALSVLVALVLWSSIWGAGPYLPLSSLGPMSFRTRFSCPLPLCLCASVSLCLAVLSARVRY